MKFSIRTKLLLGIVVVNLLGGVVTMVYLHQSYSGGVAADATRALERENATWMAIQNYGVDELGPLTDPKNAASYVSELKKISGADYALLLDKSVLDKTTYATQRQALGLSNNFDEGGRYVQVALTNSSWTKEFQFSPAADTIPVTGKLIGVKNGACSRTCHGSVTGQGDYWGVTWSKKPGITEADGVVPVSSGGRRIGVLYSIQNFSEQADAARSSILRTIFVISITLLGAAIVIGMMMDTWVFRRLNKMTAAIEDLSVRVAGGDFDAHFEPDGTDDEIGEFEKFFARFMDLISATVKSLSNR
jgi:methyl-accepting chemotaxis protein